MILAECLEGNLTEYDIEYRVHAPRRMFERDIDQGDVELILRQGDIIERYDDDFPLPSLLLNGRTSTGGQLHVVVAVNSLEKKLVIITVYEPDPLEWTNDFSRRQR